MNNNDKRNNNLKFVFSIILAIFVIFVFFFSTSKLNNSVDFYTIENGEISYEEPAEAIIIRDEQLLSEEGYEKGITQIALEGEKVAKNSSVIRSYTADEDEKIKQIEDINKEINKAIEENSINVLSSDIINIEAKIESYAEKLNGLNDIQKIEEIHKKIDDLMASKTRITADACPEGSAVKQLIKQKNTLLEELNNGANIVKSPTSGIVSYRIDGLEKTLKTNDFSYLNKEVFDSIEIKMGATIPLNNNNCKIINNFNSYIAIFMNTEKANTANVGDEVTLRLTTGNILPAKIVYLGESTKDGRVIVFEIREGIENLIEFRKISMDVIWWDYSGYKVSNSVLISRDGKNYVQKYKTTSSEIILVKVKRQNDTYSIISNYTDEELSEMGLSQEEINKRTKIKLYDRLLVQK